MNPSMEDHTYAQTRFHTPVFKRIYVTEVTVVSAATITDLHENKNLNLEQNVDSNQNKTDEMSIENPVKRIKFQPNNVQGNDMNTDLHEKENYSLELELELELDQKTTDQMSIQKDLPENKIKFQPHNVQGNDVDAYLHEKENLNLQPNVVSNQKNSDEKMSIQKVVPENKINLNVEQNVELNENNTDEILEDKIKFEPQNVEGNDVDTSSIDEMAKEFTITCEFCDDTFANDEYYRAHLEIHLEQWQGKSPRLKKSSQ